jgi:hypothetical protein
MYDWFTEGFDTADLKEAAALLASWHSSGLGLPLAVPGRFSKCLQSARTRRYSGV